MAVERKSSEDRVPTHLRLLAAPAPGLKLIHRRDSPGRSVLVVEHLRVGGCSIREHCSRTSVRIIPHRLDQLCRPAATKKVRKVKVLVVDLYARIFQVSGEHPNVDRKRGLLLRIALPSLGTRIKASRPSFRRISHIRPSALSETVSTPGRTSRMRSNGLIPGLLSGDPGSKASLSTIGNNHLFRVGLLHAERIRHVQIFIQLQAHLLLHPIREPGGVDQLPGLSPERITRFRIWVCRRPGQDRLHLLVDVRDVELVTLLHLHLQRPVEVPGLDLLKCDVKVAGNLSPGLLPEIFCLLVDRGKEALGKALTSPGQVRPRLLKLLTNLRLEVDRVRRVLVLLETDLFPRPGIKDILERPTRLLHCRSDFSAKRGSRNPVNALLCLRRLIEPDLLVRDKRDLIPRHQITPAAL